jgi:hypothetical protein
MKRRELTDEEKDEAERLKQAWETYRFANKGATQTWLAAESGLGTQGAVSQYMRGVIPLNVEALAAMCRVLQLDPHTISPRLMKIVQVLPADPGPDGNFGLKPGTFMRVRGVDADDPALTQIMKVKLKVRAGVTGFQTEPEYYDGDTLGVPTSWIEREGLRKEALLSMVVKGDSMEPNLHDGDTIVVNTADKNLVSGIVYVVNYEGEAVIKRMLRDAGRWWLSSDNPDQHKYHRQLCKGADCIVIGKVIRKESTHI